MKKVGTTYKKDGIRYLVVDNYLILRFEFRGNDAYYNHNGVTYSLGMSKNTVDVSSVTDMGRVFWRRDNFNADISKWDVSGVTDMNRMFLGAHSFNADISNWDVSSVTDMTGMFESAQSFNGDISKWDVSSVTSMRMMFCDAKKFSADISNWGVSNVTNMSWMFLGAHSFNADISNWDVSSVTDMCDIFRGKIINDINNHNIPKWYTDRHQIKLTIDKQKQILNRCNNLPDEDKKAILKIISLGLDWFYYKGSDFII